MILTILNMKTNIKKSIFYICWLFISIFVQAQMNFDNKLQFGNEWIKKNQRYYKLKLAEDGIYRLNYQSLLDAGVPISSIPGENFQLFQFGSEIPIYVSASGIFGASDYIEFYGQKNRSELDAALFPIGTPMMNTEYSMFADSAVYFLSWSDQPSSQRIQAITNDLSNPLPKDFFYINKQIITFNELATKRSFGYRNSQKLPDFDEGQGYATNSFADRNFNLNFKHAYLQGGPANIEVTVFGHGEDFTAHRVNFEINNEPKDFITFAGFKVRSPVIQLFGDELQDQMVLNVKANGNPEDRISVSTIKYDYQASFQFDQQNLATIYLPASIIRKYLEIENFNGGDEIIIYDLTNQISLTSRREPSGIYRLTIPPSTQERKIIIVAKDAVRSNISLNEKEFKHYSAADYDYLILSSKRLIEGTLGDGMVEEYTNYRSSFEGGSYKVFTVAVEDLFDEFGFGIHGHSISLRNFFQYSRQIWPQLKHVLILGKGLEYQIYRKSGLDQNNFVPTYSMPAADYLMISDENRLPFLALGRLPAINGAEIKFYLDKVKEHEAVLRNTTHSLESREWIKRVVHLSGGDPTLFATISNQLETMESVIENNTFGANVETFYKQSSNPIEVSSSDRLKYLVDNGVSIISFMGHSLSTRLDFNLENISSYQNKGKYHLFMAMGCYAGQMFENIRSISEVHNLASDRGSIVYLANSTAGLPYILSIYGSEFYKQIGEERYGLTVGEAVQYSNRKMIEDYLVSKNEAIAHQALSISYNGDPAIRLLSPEGSDFIPDGSTVKTNPAFIYADKGKFALELDIVNVGKSIKDSIRVLIQNENSLGQKSVVFDGLVASPILRNKYSFDILLPDSNAVGFNKIFLTVDSDHKISELPLPIAEDNNDLFSTNGEEGFRYFVLDNDIFPVFPLEFAIIDQATPTLIANTGNMFSKSNNYYFELDTTAYFNSPVKQEKSITQVGGVIRWKLDANLNPNTVYYWRTRPDSNSTGVLAWRNSSFIQMPNVPNGWNQSHFFQDIKNDFEKIKLEEPNRRFEFKESLEDFRVFNALTKASHFLRPKIFYQGEVKVDYNEDVYKKDFSGILVSVFSPTEGNLWINQTGGDFGSYLQPNAAGKPFFVFKTETKLERESLIQFLENDIPQDAVVALMTLAQENHSFFPELWESDGSINLFSTLKKLGAQNVENLKVLGSIPYIFIYRNGRSDYIPREKFGDQQGEVDLSHFIPIRFVDGKIQSRIIGPAISYEKCIWNVEEVDLNSDQVGLDIVGIQSNGQETVLFSNLTSAETDLSTVDAKLYPQLKLVWSIADATDRTSAQKDFWRVLYQGLPDVAIDQSIGFVLSADTLSQGEIFRVDLSAANISQYDMDSLLVKFTLVGSNNSTETVLARLSPVEAFGNLRIPFAKNTSRQIGAYQLFVELNPNNDQPELHHFNNIGVINYFVARDKRRPRFILRFNGLVIQDGDFVSALSKIDINLRDENSAFPIDDTSLFSIKLRYPDRSIKDIYFSQSNVQFIPAVSGNSRNEASVIIDQEFEQNGTYEIIVRAKDPNGNYISDSEVRTSFVIKKENSISNIFNYPNPFTSKTKFVYTLTGNGSPSYYKMQILTVSGKIVKEIDQSEMGPLNVGTHITEYEYDGTDEFGTKLANGVYLYRMVVKDDSGSDFKKLDTGTDQFFQHGFGKMVILR